MKLRRWEQKADKCLYIVITRGDIIQNRFSPMSLDSVIFQQTIQSETDYYYLFYVVKF